MFQSSSSRSVAPLREMPANNPRERDQVRISAVKRASVSACVERPTGPAATVASPPSVNFVESNRSTPLSFMISMKTSISDPPIWNPTLPPSTRTAPGADQPTPPFLRQETKPLPYLAPMMKAPFLRSGTITMHSALFSRSWGMDFSGMSITSLSAPAALCRRLGASDAAESRVAPRANAAKSFLFIGEPPGGSRNSHTAILLTSADAAQGRGFLVNGLEHGARGRAVAPLGEEVAPEFPVKCYGSGSRYDGNIDP